MVTFTTAHQAGPGIVHGGRSEYDMGPVVTVQTPSKLTINLTQRRVVPSSIGHMTSTGLDPRSFQVIVGKGVHSPLLGLQPYCKKLIRVNTPGAYIIASHGLEIRGRADGAHLKGEAMGELTVIFRGIVTHFKELVIGPDLRIVRATPAAASCQAPPGPFD